MFADQRHQPRVHRRPNRKRASGSACRRPGSDASQPIGLLAVQCGGFWHLDAERQGLLLSRVDDGDRTLRAVLVEAAQQARHFLERALRSR